MTPSPPRTRWLARAGNGLTVSKSRNRRNPVTSVGSVSGNASTESVIPATSSMTIAPGSLLPRPRSARCAAHVPAGLEAAAAEIDHTVDLRRLAGGATLEGERRILARAVHEHVRDRPHERLVALPRDPVLEVLDNRRALGRDLGGHLVGEPGRRRSVLGRVREDAEPVEAHLVEKLEEILKRRLRFAREADQHWRPDGAPTDPLAKRRDALLPAPGGDGPAHGAQHAVVPVLHGEGEARD